VSPPEAFLASEGAAHVAATETSAHLDSPSESRMSTKAIWFEVFAVLSIGVFPGFIGAIVSLAHHESSEIPFWLDATERSWLSACAFVAVLYIIFRSGEPWSFFGVKRFRFYDFGLAVVIVAADFILACFLSPIARMSSSDGLVDLTIPHSKLDYLLLLIMEATNGFAEEIVCRGYLVARFQQLLGSRLSAVALSSTLFASYHIYYGPTAVLLHIFLLGILFGSLYLLIRRVWPFAIAHALINISIVLLRR